MKRFNTSAYCNPSIHYMVDISERVNQTRQMIDRGDYFIINRPRQYGKTTILSALRESLVNEYTVLYLDFQLISSTSFQSEDLFVRTMCRRISRMPKETIPTEINRQLKELAKDVKTVLMDELFDIFSDWAGMVNGRMVLIIDEVDSASNYDVFLDFLSQLRGRYIERKYAPTFQSVILAGVTDIRYLKSRIRDDQDSKVNSPWNIAVPFNVDMSFNSVEIAGMLEEFEQDHHTGMDIPFISQQIYDYTSGYPYLVSRLCQIMDEELTKAQQPWSRKGMDEAVKKILKETNPLFDSLIAKVTNNPEIFDILEQSLLRGDKMLYMPDNEKQKQLMMYGFLKEKDDNTVAVANRIFETRLYNKFLGESRFQKTASSMAELNRNIFTKDGFLDVPLVLDRFAKAYEDVIGNVEKKFNERDGRELFLLYLKPIINGTGNYYIEAETRDETKTDVIVDYLGKQYIIELKIWRGKRYNEDGESQLKGYLDYYRLDTGYMMSFNFNKKKTTGVERLTIGDKTLFEAVV